MAIKSVSVDDFKMDTHRIDNVFESYDHKDSPGCAVCVIYNGHVVHKKGYGVANLEYVVPIKPATVFHVASVSKQFTAFAVHLLVEDGKLSLEDDVGKYLPELHDFETVITVQHLIHHTSGLRDQWSLLNLAGWRFADVITEDDILNLVWRQRELNFAPGTEELYSNTGYTLLGLIVKRISGKSLRAFCQERIFAPLGMKKTHFHDDNTELVPKRAYSYGSRASGGFLSIPLQYANVGATSLFTTIEDLARWDRNFYATKVGGPSVIAAMLQRGKLANGDEINYASALLHGEYRGLKTVGHNGSDAGFRSAFLRFPEQNFSVIVLSNLAPVDASLLARQVADIYLEDSLAPIPTPPGEVSPEQPVTVSPEIYDAYAGMYQLFPHLFMAFTQEEGRLMLRLTGGEKQEVCPTSETEYYVIGAPFRLRFVVGEGGKVEQVIVLDGGQELPAPRTELTDVPLTQLPTYEGQYYSRELNTVYEVSLLNGVLMLRYARGQVSLDTIGKDEFVGAYPIGRVRFIKDAKDSISGLSISSGRIRNIRFERISIGANQAKT